MKFSAVLLAGGQGRRAGGYKPLFQLHHTTVIEHVMTAALSICSDVRIVGGAYFEELSHHLQDVDSRVTLICNRQWQKGGMFSSVRAGLAGVKTPAFIHPVDFAGSGAQVYRKLADTFLETEYPVCRPIYKGKPGHPILISAGSAELVMRAPSSQTLRNVLMPLQKGDVPVDTELVHFGFNTLEEFAVLKRKILRQCF
jgi:CTP:molybdopterin cytidylyltransferase MocA